MLGLTAPPHRAVQVEAAAAAYTMLGCLTSLAVSRMFPSVERTAARVQAAEGAALVWEALRPAVAVRQKAAVARQPAVATRAGAAQRPVAERQQLAAVRAASRPAEGLQQRAERQRAAG